VWYRDGHDERQLRCFMLALVCSCAVSRLPLLCSDGGRSGGREGETECVHVRGARAEVAESSEVVVGGREDSSS
jgi:hypothetical protein